MSDNNKEPSLPVNPEALPFSDETRRAPRNARRRFDEAPPPVAEPEIEGDLAYMAEEDEDDTLPELPEERPTPRNKRRGSQGSGREDNDIPEYKATRQAAAPIPSAEPAGAFSRMISSPKAPLAFFGALVLGVLLLLGGKYAGNLTLPGLSPRVVVFDPVKFMNSQRAAVSVLAVRPNSTLEFSIAQVAKQAEAVILEEAKGAIVLVKQAVVVPTSAVDITDRVLVRFGLPTDVPTMTMNHSDSLMDVAPSNYSFSPQETSDTYKEELLQRSQRISAEVNGAKSQEGALP